MFANYNAQACNRYFANVTGNVLPITSSCRVLINFLASCHKLI